MLKRDKSGRFLKKSGKQSVKNYRVKKAKVKVQKIAKKARVKDISDLTFWDLKDMISAEVALQMRY
jgi:hypothetical protein